MSRLPLRSAPPFLPPPSRSNISPPRGAEVGRRALPLPRGRSRPHPRAGRSHHLGVSRGFGSDRSGRSVSEIRAAAENRNVWDTFQDDTVIVHYGFRRDTVIVGRLSMSAPILNRSTGTATATTSSSPGSSLSGFFPECLETSSGVLVQIFSFCLFRTLTRRLSRVCRAFAVAVAPAIRLRGGLTPLEFAVACPFTMPGMETRPKPSSSSRPTSRALPPPPRRNSPPSRAPAVRGRPLPPSPVSQSGRRGGFQPSRSSPSNMPGKKQLRTKRHPLPKANPGRPHTRKSSPSERDSDHLGVGEALFLRIARGEFYPFHHERATKVHPEPTRLAYLIQIISAGPCDILGRSRVSRQFHPQYLPLYGMERSFGRCGDPEVESLYRSLFSQSAEAMPATLAFVIRGRRKLYESCVKRVDFVSIIADCSQSSSVFEHSIIDVLRLWESAEETKWRGRIGGGRLIVSQLGTGNPLGSSGEAAATIRFRAVLRGLKANGLISWKYLNQRLHSALSACYFEAVEALMDEEQMIGPLYPRSLAEALIRAQTSFPESLFRRYLYDPRFHVDSPYEGLIRAATLVADRDETYLRLLDERYQQDLFPGKTLEKFARMDRIEWGEITFLKFRALLRVCRYLKQRREEVKEAFQWYRDKEEYFAFLDSVW